jgi:hypothetical protein
MWTASFVGVGRLLEHVDPLDEPYQPPRPGVWRVVANQVELPACSCGCGDGVDEDVDLPPEPYGCCPW